MSKRHGRPGMPPSPHQAIVLDALKTLCWFSSSPTGVTIDTVHEYLEANKLGGGVFSYRPEIYRRQHTDGFCPWHRSTVRDHMNDLHLKALVTKTVGDDRKARYRPTTSSEQFNAFVRARS